MAGRRTLTAATRADLDALEALENAVFDGDRLSRRSLLHHITTPTTGLFVLKMGEHLAGYCLVAFRKGSTLARLFSIAVDPAERRGGVGRALLAASERAAKARACRALRLEVRSDNKAAISLYERNGYRYFGTFADYYEDGASAFRFEKDLTPSRRTTRR